MNIRSKPLLSFQTPIALLLSTLIAAPAFAQNIAGGLPLIGLFSPEGNASPLSLLVDTGLVPRGITSLPALADAGQLLLSNNDGPLGIVTGLGGPLKGQLFPAFDVLVADPASLLDYFIAGGTILSPELVIVPPIPIFSSPIGL